MSLVDYASSSDEDDNVPEPTEEQWKEKEEPQRHSRPQTLTKPGSSSNQELENRPHSSSPKVEKLPDASLLLSSPGISSNLMNASDHSSRVAAALAENASRERDPSGKTSSAIRSKVPRGNPPHSKNIPETAGGLLVPPQLSGRKNIVTEDISKLFVRKHQEHPSA